MPGRINKTGNFKFDVHAGYYRQEREDVYRRRKDRLCEDAAYTFHDDFDAWLLANGVPAQYMRKVAEYVWDQWHANGEEEVVNYAEGLVDIFKEPK